MFLQQPSPSKSITARLLASLPESIWAEANRRLRLVPELWTLAEDDAVLTAFCALGGDPLNWRPGPLALAAFAAKHPDCAGNAEVWLLGEARERVTTAYDRLLYSDLPLDPLAEALPAALALRPRLYATRDWAALAEDATHFKPERWRLPLQYLWSLLETQADLLTALLKSNATGAELAGQCLVVNHTHEEAVKLVAGLNLSLPAHQWLVFAQALESLGAGDLSCEILKLVTPPPPPREATLHPPLELKQRNWDKSEADHALLLAATGNFSAARPALVQAWTQTKKLSAHLSAKLGELALEAGDPVSALAGYQDALTEQPTDPELRAGLARALLALNKASEALTALGSQRSEHPASLVIAAQAQSALELKSEAQETLKLITEDSSPKILAEAAHLYAELNDQPNAIRLMKRAADTDAARTRAAWAKHLTAARWLLDSSRPQEAREMALGAVALSPENPEARETLGQALLECNDHLEALKHFQSALVFDPLRLSSALGLARAALAAGQPHLAHDTAQRVLSVETESPLQGQAHTLIGQALSALGQDDQAFEHFRRASALVPAAPEPWRAMARHYLQRDQLDQALAALEAGRQALALVSSPETAPLLAELAHVYESLGRFTEAISALREACAADPKSQVEYRRLGVLLRRQGHTAEALEALHHALQLLPGEASALHELGRVFEQMGQVDEAWAAYQQAALAQPADPRPYFDLGRVTLDRYRQGMAYASPWQAIAALKQAVEHATSRAPHPGPLPSGERENPPLPEGEGTGVRVSGRDFGKSPAQDTNFAAEVHALLAQAQQLVGEMENALENYQNALHLAPLRTDLSLGLGQVCLELNRPEAAITALQDALTHAPAARHPGVLETLARAYAQSNLWPEASQTAEAALRCDPENPALFELLAEAATRLGQSDQALNAWKQAIALNPRDIQRQVRFARGLLDAGRADEARGVYAQALSLGPDSPEAHLAAGNAFLELGEVEQAYEVLQQAIELAPRSAEVQAAFGQAAARAHKYEAAHAAFTRAAELEPSPDRCAYLREAGEALWAMGRFAAATAAWQSALASQPRDNLTLARLGMALVHLGQHAEALAALEKAAEQNPQNVNAIREAARAALALNELEKAAQYLERVIDVSPGDAEARFLLGRAREQQGEMAEALSLYRQAARLNPGEGRYLAAAAETLARLGDLEEAVKVMSSAQSISPDNPEVQQRAGEIYLQAGHAAQAARAFQELVSARPHEANAYLALAQALVRLAEQREIETRAKLSSTLNEAENRMGVMPALHQAAALGADPQAVRYWMGRAKAVTGDPKEAQQLLEAVLVSPAPGQFVGAELYRALGSALRKSGQLDRAREALQAALKSNRVRAVGERYLLTAAPKGAGGDNHTDALTLLELGLTLSVAGDRRGAVAALKRAVAVAPEAAIAFYHLAEELSALGDLPEAAQVLQRAVTLRPEAAAWHARLAHIYQAQNDGAKALAHLQRAAELEPRNADFAARLARLLARDGDLTAAAELFRRATEAQPAAGELWAERGHVHLALNDLDCAGACFARAIQLTPTHVAALLGGARVSLAVGDLLDAGNKAQTAARLAPDNSETLICLADVQAAKGEVTAAEDNYQRAVLKAPEPGPALLALGRLYHAQLKLEQAIEVLEQAAALAPQTDEIPATLGDVHVTAGNHTAALAAYREAARLAPRQPKHLLRLGRTCRAQGQLDQALAHLLQASDLAPSDDEILRETGLVFEQRRQYDRALEMYQIAIQAAPRSAENHTRAGKALKQMKDYAGAVNAFERAVALDPKNLEATKQLAVVSALNLMHGN
jgi:tetratricopeptide (TPR) repeat protein